MMRLRPLLLPLLLALLTLPARCPFAAPTGLTVAAGQGTVTTDGAAGRYDFGTRRMADESPLEHTFTLRNDSAVPITIDRLQSSCGCTTAFLDGEQSPPLTVGPGGVVPVRVSIAPHRLAPGPVTKSVWVYTHGSAEAATLLEITGTLQDEDAPASPAVPLPAVPLPAAAPRSAARPAVTPASGQLAPAFTLPDTRGRPFALDSVQGRPVALFFFCGCPWCADAARAWGRAQRAKLLPAATRTVVVFAGSPTEASAFAARNGLDLARTTLLPDPDSALTEGLYHLNTCPRAFALGAAGVIRYTNDHADDQPRVASAQTITRRTLRALGQTLPARASR